MADISKEIKDFREAVYGEDVRDSMISLAEKVNEEAENSTDKVAEYNEAEASRVQAETARVNAEKARVTAETGRVSAEKNRASAESTRADNEASRVDAEDDRVTAETARKTAEETRASSETNRKSAETKRTTAETERVNAEKSRVTAENERASAETERVNAENERVAAETNRRTNTAKAIEDCDEAAARANAAAEAAEGVVDGTGLVMSTEKGTANGVATLDENGKVPQAQIDGNNMPITFEQAAQRANIQSGDSLAVAFGKLAKFCADLDDHAFSAPVNNLTGTDPSLPLAATQGKVLSDNINLVEKAVKGFFSAETNVSIKTFCDNIFELSHNLSFFAIPFRFRIAAEWSPNSAIGWIRGMVFIQNTNYAFSEIGQMLACMGNDAWIGNILTSSGEPKIDWIKIT